MSKMKKRSRVITAFSASLLLSLAIAGGASADTSASEFAPGAKTSAPPIEMNINTINPLATYLKNTSSDIRKLSSSNVQITANTTATQTVDSVGVNFTFQRWTGSVWIDIDSASGSSSNTSVYNGSSSFTAAAGYYYRGRTIHYVRKGSSYEEQVMFTQTLLMG